MLSVSPSRQTLDLMNLNIPLETPLTHFKFIPASSMSRISIIFRSFTCLIFLFQTLDADIIDSFSYNGFRNGANFESNIALYGDAKLVNGSYSSVSLSAGRLLYKKHIMLVEGNPRKLVSFSTYFSFVLSPENGDGLAFFMAPLGFPTNRLNVSSSGLSSGLNERKIRFFAVEFDAFKDGDLNERRVGVDIGGLASVGVKNVTSTDMVLNSGETLHCWIDYQAGSRRFEIRLSKLGDIKPIDPLLVHSIDLSIKWKEEEVFVGLSSSNGNSSQTCVVYSWNFKLWDVPQWMHSEPLDPNVYAENARSLRPQKRSCVSKVIAALIFGTGCGALGAFVVLCVWSIFVSRRPVVPEEISVLPDPVEYDFKKVVLVIDKAIKDGEK